MKLLFDQNLSPELVGRLKDLYPDSDHVCALGLDCFPDREVRDFAQLQGFLIVTKDADFSDLCVLLGFPPKVVWIRRGNCSTTEIEQILRRHHADIIALDADAEMGILSLL